MRRLINSGKYYLAETRHHTKILHLDAASYAWVESWRAGEILVLSTKSTDVNKLLGSGHYSLFEVVDDPDLSDQQHLELEVGKDIWQGYLLPTGLPRTNHKRSRIIPTTERINKSRLLQKNSLHSPA